MRSQFPEPTYMHPFTFESSNIDSQTLTLCGPADLVAAIPYLLEFTPVDCLVAVFLSRENQQVLLTIRSDLPAQAALRDYTSFWSERLALVHQNNSVDAVVLCVFTRSGAETPITDAAAGVKEVLTTIADVCTDVGLHVYDQLVVIDERWRSMLCADVSCCPDAGTAVEQARADRIAAEFVVSGIDAASTRNERVESLQPFNVESEEARHFARNLDAETGHSGDHISPTSAATSGTDDADDSALEFRERVVRESVAYLVAGDANARTVLALADTRLRDGIIRALTHEVDENQRRTAEIALIQLMRVSPVELRAASASVAAGLAWQRGDGVTAAACLDVALDAEPTYSLARLLRRAVAAAVPPSVWVSAVGQTTMQECLGVGAR